MERIRNESIRAHVRCLEVKPFIVFEDNIFSPSFRERVYFFMPVKYHGNSIV